MNVSITQPVLPCVRCKNMAPRGSTCVIMLSRNKDVNTIVWCIGHSFKPQIFQVSGNSSWCSYIVELQFICFLIHLSSNYQHYITLQQLCPVMHGQEDKLSALAVISIGLSHYIVADKHVILSASWGTNQSKSVTTRWCSSCWCWSNWMKHGYPLKIFPDNFIRVMMIWDSA